MRQESALAITQSRPEMLRWSQRPHRMSLAASHQRRSNSEGSSQFAVHSQSKACQMDFNTPAILEFSEPRGNPMPERVT